MFDLISYIVKILRLILFSLFFDLLIDLWIEFEYFLGFLDMNTKSVEDLMECSSEVHYSGFHMDGLEQRKGGTEQPTTSAIDEYKQPFLIGLYFFGV